MAPEPMLSGQDIPHAEQSESVSKIVDNLARNAQPDKIPTPNTNNADFELGAKPNPQDTASIASTYAADFSDEPPAASSKPRVPIYRPSVRPPMAILKLFHDGELNFTGYPMMTPRFQIGRREGDLVVAHDVWMSGRHAEIQRRQIGNVVRWYLLDANSTNGTFIRLPFTLLKHRDELFIGRERYRFQFIPPNASLLHVTRSEGETWPFNSPVESIGSQVKNQISCAAADPFLDPIHATFTKNVDGTWIVRDNNSQNGIWFRVREVELTPDTQFQLGEQRFGFWFQR